ncbi:MAG: carbamoyltransferase [Planctomycetota bacterium]|nr:carbamoyltransferase [Planctomycetota bacterium]
MRILGISAFYHDSAAALLVDGRIVAAAQEERFTRKKHDARFPSSAIEYCLREAGISAADLDAVAFYDKPLLKFERMIETWVGVAPRGFKMFRVAIPMWMRGKLHLEKEIRKGLGGKYQGRIVYTEHHESHAASAFFPSPFEDAAVLTMDGVGEWATASIGHGRGNHLEMLHQLRFPHSLGLLYSTFTAFCGFRINSGEYKLMGLAPYGTAKHKDAILQNLLDLKEDGSFRLDMSYFGYCHSEQMHTEKFAALFGGPARKPETALSQREMDLAASVQAVTEEVMLRMARHARKLTGSKNLVMAGGVALNCVGNGKILRDGCFDKMWIQPAAGDAGGALGAALFTWHQLLGKPREVKQGDLQFGSLLGPSYTSEEVRRVLDAAGAKYQHHPQENDLIKSLVGHIRNGKVIGHVAGRMEFGPRALGARSIIGDARSREMQSVMNLKIKYRESFRPFAPIVLREEAHNWFEIDEQDESPYMLIVAPVREDKRIAANGDADGLVGLDKLKIPRSEIPAVTHMDYSARLQTLDEERHGRVYRLVREFANQSGCPVMINTSFNVRGEPIVCTPEDAYRCFMMTEMDVLVVEDCVMVKEEQPNAEKFDRQKHLAAFDLD